MNAKEGDVVRVIEDEARAASLNSFLINGRGGWSSEMKSCLGTLATVIEVVQFESKRLLKLKFKNDKEFDFNSKSVSLVTETEEEEEEFVIDGVKSKQQNDEDKEDRIVGAEDFFPIFLASLVYVSLCHSMVLLYGITLRYTTTTTHTGTPMLRVFGS